MAWISGEQNASGSCNVAANVGVELNSVTNAGTRVTISYRAYIYTTGSWSRNAFGLWTEGTKHIVKSAGTQSVTNRKYYTPYATKVVTIPAGSTSTTIIIGVNGKAHNPTSPAGNYWFTVGGISTVAKPTITNLTTSPSRTSIYASFSITNTGGDTPDSYIDVFSNEALTEGYVNFATTNKGTATGLTPNTDYWFRGNAGNSAGRTFTAVKRERTLGNAPVVNGITIYPGQTSASYVADVTCDTNDSIAYERMDYGTTEEYGQHTVTPTMEGLATNTTYYYKYTGTGTSGRSGTYEGSFKTDYATQEIKSVRVLRTSSRSLAFEINVPNPSWLENIFTVLRLDGEEVERQIITQNISDSNVLVFNGLQPETTYVLSAQIGTKGSREINYSAIVTTEGRTSADHLITKMNSNGEITGHSMYAIGRANVYNPGSLNWQNGIWSITSANVGSTLDGSFHNASVSGACTVYGLPVITDTDYILTNNQAGVKMTIIGTNINDVIVQSQIELVPGQTHTYNSGDAEKLYISILPMA